MNFYINDTTSKMLKRDYRENIVELLNKGTPVITCPNYPYQAEILQEFESKGYNVTNLSCPDTLDGKIPTEKFSNREIPNMKIPCVKIDM